MFSAKVIGAVVIIVVIIALVLVNFEGITEKFRGVLKGGSPIATGQSGLPLKGTGALDLTVYPTNGFILKPDAPLNITVESTGFSDFLGEIRIDYLNKTIKFVDSRTPLKVDFRLGKVVLGPGLRLDKLSLSNVKLNITKDGWSKIIENGTVEVVGFFGAGEIRTNALQIIGNVSSFAEK